ncbi:MAG: SAM-dependent methyltransferase [Acidimicrobiales bacterium]
MSGPGPSSLTDRLVAEIGRDGPMPVSRYVEAALYDPVGGFYTAGGRAGRRGDFLTAPEVGPLFGAVVARAIDHWWTQAGRPAVFPVLEWGAGPGTLARAVVQAAPEVAGAGALRWCAIEISDAQREAHPDDPAVVSAATLDEARGRLGGLDPSGVIPFGVVWANELLDNLPFDVYRRDGSGWRELRVDVAAAGDEEVPGSRFRLVPAPLPTSTLPTPTSPTSTSPTSAATVGRTLDRLCPDSAEGTTVPWQGAAGAWLDEALGSIGAGRVVVFDYGDTTPVLADRGGWIRTHRRHAGGVEWLETPGACDVTVDVAFDQLALAHDGSDRRPTLDRPQADFLRAHGIDELVAEGRRYWEAHAHIGDLASLRARSRVQESAALLDATGLGAFRVLEWVVDGPGD